MKDRTVSRRIGKFTRIGLAAVLAATLCPIALSSSPEVALAEPTAAEKQAEAQAALASLEAMQDNLDEASDDQYAAEQELAAAQAAMDEATARIDEANAEISQLQDRLGNRACSMYRSGATSFLDILFGAATFQEFATAWDLLNEFNKNDAELVQQTKDLRAEIEEQQAEYARQEQIAEEKVAEMTAIREEAEATVAAMQATYDSLSAEAAELLEAERQARIAIEQEQAQQVVEDAIADAEENWGANAGGTGAETTPDVGGTTGETTGGTIDTGTTGGTDTSGGNSGFYPSYNPVTGNAVVDRAYGCLGAPYVWGGVGPDGFDCSGLVSYAVSGSFTRLGTTTTFMASWTQVYDPQPGDVAVNAGHCGIYIGGGQMIHAATYGVGVIIGPVQSGMIFVRPW